MATKLPRQIQAQLDAAEAALAAQNQPPAPPAPPTVPEPPAPPAPPTPDPIVEATPPQPPAPPAATPPSENWEHKYRVLQGMFNQTNRQVQELTTRLTELTRAPAPAPTPAPTAPPTPTADPNDVNAFGLDMVQMVQRTTEQVLARAAQVIEGRFQQIENTVSMLKNAIEGTSQTVAQTAEELFFEKLTEAAPEWEQLNTHGGFLAWLSEKDPISGITRDAALKSAQESGDAKRAAAIFKAFLATLPPPPAAPPAGSPTPRTAGSPPPAPTPSKPTYTQKQVTDFYADVARGRYRGREKERAETEAMYNAALAEGRIM